MDNLDNVMEATGHDQNNSDIYMSLKRLCIENEDFFVNDQSEYGLRLNEAFYGLRCHIDAILPLVSEIREIAPLYDFDEETPGNGYRSFVGVVDCCIKYSTKLALQISHSRDNLLFRKGHYMKEIEACSHLLASLNTCLSHLKTMSSWCEVGELFPKDDHRPEELFATTSAINQYSFYGRCLGFQYCESMRSILKGLSICMAGFSEAYYSNGNLLSKATSSVFAGGKYVLDPELRARRIVNISQSASVDFCKSFWSLSESEIMQRLPSVICNHGIAVNRIISIPPEKLELPSVQGEGIIEIPVPMSHGGPKPVQVRLISSKRREGMIGEANSECVLPSRGLVVHLHGGGFVAQSSKSHETYLREWALELGVPIISIDYSLAPESPFPRACEEVFYAYCWALKHCSLLGTTAERVVLAGDSAGANLHLGLALRCIETGIRSPSGIFVAYVPVLVSFVPSPARLLCLMDPLLPFGFMMRCLKAYACPNMLNVNNKFTSSMSAPEHTNISPVSESMVGGPVSESDLAELEARRSSLNDELDSDSDTITGASLSSITTNVPLMQYNAINLNKSENDDNINIIHNAKETNEKEIYEAESLHVTIIEPDGNLPNNTCLSNNKNKLEYTKELLNATVSNNEDGSNVSKNSNLKIMCDATTEPITDKYKITEALQGLMQRTQNVKNNVKNFMFNGSATLPSENILDSMPNNVTEPTLSNIGIKDDISNKTIIFEKQSSQTIHNIKDNKHNLDENSPFDTTKTLESNENQQETIMEDDEFVNEFLEKYVLDVTSGEEPRIRNASTSYDDFSLSDLPQEIALGIHERITRVAQKFLSTVSNTFTSITSSNEIPPVAYADISVQSNLDALIARSPSDEFIFQVPKDPYLSPYWADDEMLKKLPPTRLLTIELDPCLDDCVMFAKKLKRLGNDVRLDVLPGLPHGFLNFSLMSKDAHRGSLLCVRRISELLDLKHLP